MFRALMMSCLAASAYAAPRALDVVLPDPTDTIPPHMSPPPPPSPPGAPITDLLDVSPFPPVSPMVDVSPFPPGAPMGVDLSPSSPPCDTNTGLCVLCRNQYVKGNTGGLDAYEYGYVLMTGACDKGTTCDKSNLPEGAKLAFCADSDGTGTFEYPSERYCGYDFSEEESDRRSLMAFMTTVEDDDGPLDAYYRSITMCYGIGVIGPMYGTYTGRAVGYQFHNWSWGGYILMHVGMFLYGVYLTLQGEKELGEPSC